jgi:uncharacterized protein (DUF488 family)
MIYRKRILLSITELFGGNTSAIDFQKLLFLFSQEQQEKKFDFVPYKYGCYSFQVMADKNNLIKEGYLENHKNWKYKSESNQFIESLNEFDRKLLIRIHSKFGKMSTSELIRYVYNNYPFFAINSEIAKDCLSKKEFEIVEKLKVTEDNQVLFTIGYESKNIDEYLCSLIKHNVKVLCDVRKNAQSRKYGFSKKTLNNACNALNIKYIHLPELGIESEKRKRLDSPSDYNKLFSEYEIKTLQNQSDTIKMILKFLHDYHRVALTCFELLPKQCHRTRIANSIHKIATNIPINHL